MIPQQFSEHDARRIIKLALEDREGWTFINSTHALDQMAARAITSIRVQSVLRQGKISEGPFIDADCWKCNFIGRADGGVEVVVAFDFSDNGGCAVVVTVINLSMH